MGFYLLRKLDKTKQCLPYKSKTPNFLIWYGGKTFINPLINALAIDRISSNQGYQMMEPAVCICENKDADQLRSNCAADQRLCFRYKDSTIPLLFKLPVIFCGSTAWFVSDLIGNAEDRFFHNEARMMG